MFNPIKPEKIYQQVNNQIQQLIIKGELKKGDRLPSERQLAEIFGVSRTSVRESLRSLEIMGLVESRPGEGSFITNNDSAIMMEPLSIMFRLSNGSFKDILEIREIIEVAAAGLAAERIDDDSLQRLKELMQELEASKDESHSIEIDKEIHYLIGRATQNFLIITVLNAISELMTDFITNSRYIIMKNINEKGRLLKIHKDVVKAISEKNPRLAQDAMRRHFYSVSESIENEDIF